MVIVAQGLIGEVVHHRHQANRHTVAGTAVGHQSGQLAVKYTHLCRVALTPFLVDNTTLLVYLLLVQSEVATPVVQDEQYAIYSRGACRGNIVDIVHGLVNGGVGIQLLTKLHTYALQIAQQGITGIVLSTVEAHVLKEMGKAALVFLLLHGTYLLCDVEVGLTGSFHILANIVGKTVGQLTLYRCLVLRQALCADSCNHADCQQ